MNFFYGDLDLRSFLTTSILFFFNVFLFYSDSLIRSRKLNYNYDLQEDESDDTLDDNPSADTNPQTNTDNQDDENALQENPLKRDHF